jgi:SAM-dependent methyltransferase
MDDRIKDFVMKQRDDVLECEYRLVEDVHASLRHKCCWTVDVGCGAIGLLGRKGDRLAALRASSIGIDTNGLALARNPNVKHRVLGSCYSLPLKTESVDLIICRWMFEHIETPEKIMLEFSRVLKKGGFVYIKTPNLWNYTMMLSWATPTVFHNAFRTATGLHENTATYYRANTKRRLTELARASGFTIRRLESHSNSYMYYSFNKELFFAMRGLSKLVGKFTERVQQILFCVLEKV